MTDQPLAPTAVRPADDALDVVSPDGRVGRALLIEPGPPQDTVLFLSVHGSGEDPSHPMHETVARGLAARGIASLRVRTRQAGSAVNTDLFYDSVRDVEAAFWAATARGYRRVVLHGHSLGSAQACYLSATLWRPEIRGVVLTGAFANLPVKTRRVLVGDDVVYRALRADALAALADRRPEDEVPTLMPWIFGRPVPVTAQHFLTYRDTRSAAARTVEWLPRVPYPTLMLRDEHDTVVAHAEFDELRSTALSGIAPGFVAQEIPSRPGTQSHWFEHSREALVGAVAGWITALPPTSP